MKSGRAERRTKPQKQNETHNPTSHRPAADAAGRSARRQCGLLEIEVVNRWSNRMIGDKQPADANVREVNGPPGFLGGQKIKAGRYTFSTSDPCTIGSALPPSGLLGPVQIQSMLTKINP
jgi:hypothetical protein